MAEYDMKLFFEMSKMYEEGLEQGLDQTTVIKNIIDHLTKTGKLVDNRADIIRIFWDLGCASNDAMFDLHPENKDWTDLNERISAMESEAVQPTVLKYQIIRGLQLAREEGLDKEQAMGRVIEDLVKAKVLSGAENENEVLNIFTELGYNRDVVSFEIFRKKFITKDNRNTPNNNSDEHLPN